ncbi:DUF262 domain-containing protein [Terrisporobacter glycolicus]|uniref:DUF262 domain-containing protein n=1 Tax=Terrisporobacter glycolicus ATCC 14880 = DSM 1288 TaxID=1121315 RepID=A0ABZ2EZV4_9FIRM|nr:DUF262 domain-containing protein [Terrisporobacter glycolicus]
MSFLFENWNVGSLLTNNKRILKIPRYQRDYSWEKKEVSEFINDILKGLKIVDSKVKTSDYFFGTALLAGNNEEQGGELEVIDGQQRITTMTILLSALAKTFYEIPEKKLGDKVWEYVMAEDDDGDIYNILSTDTKGDFFEYLIQMKGKCKKNPVDEEQERILLAYDEFRSILSEENLKKRLEKIHKSESFRDIEYVELLKGIRHQLIGSKIICIIVTDRKDSNTIFEILNGRGKKLDSIDIIKNTIFKELNTVNPTDHAYNVWCNIKDNLLHEDSAVEFPVFFNHYWKSKYKNSSENEIYSDFINLVNKSGYKDFIEDMEYMSKIYMKLLFPARQHYGNKQQYDYIVEHLEYFNNTLDVSQVRIALLSLFSCRFTYKYIEVHKKSMFVENEKGILSGKKFKEILTYLHQFHFVYIGLCGKRGSALTNKFTNFSKCLFNSKTKDEVNKAIDNLKQELDSIYPSYSEFEEAFIKLEFREKSVKRKTNKVKKNNMLSKYVLYNIEKYYSDEDVQKRNGSVEHILPENKEDENTFNIGNLILLENYINSKIGDDEFSKKIDAYDESDYKFINKFIEEYKSVKEFNKNKIEERAKKLAKVFYEDVLKRK